MRRFIFAIISVFTFNCLISADLAGAAPAITDFSVTRNIEANLDAFNMCEALPGTVIEGALKLKLVSAPERFSFSNDGKNSGCTYDGGKDRRGDAVFAWAALVTPKTFAENKKADAAPVKGIGEDAYFINGADARQLWILIAGGKAAVIAIGDRPNETAAKMIANELITRMPK